jgi:hypothetical protein
MIRYPSKCRAKRTALPNIGPGFYFRSACSRREDRETRSALLAGLVEPPDISPPRNAADSSTGNQKVNSKAGSAFFHLISESWERKKLAKMVKRASLSRPGH